MDRAVGTCRTVAATSSSSSGVAVITGGNSGIGRALTVALASAGFDVGITWRRDEARMKSVGKEVAKVAPGARFESLHLDLHDLAAASRAVDDLADRLGGLDVLVNNAAYGTSKPFPEIDLAEWQGCWTWTRRVRSCARRPRPVGGSLPGLRRRRLVVASST